VMGALGASPQLSALARGWVAASATPVLHEAQRELEAAVLPWFEKALVAGQGARAVRKDVPLGLLIGLVFGMGRAMDTWLLMERLDDESVGKLVPLFVGMIRRALSP
jgi:hypothetical protein